LTEDFFGVASNQKLFDMNNDIGHMVDIFRYRKDVKVIVITGGPCGGKSTFMKMAKAHLEKQGFFVVIIPEAARQLIAAGFHPVKTPWKQDTGFQELVLKTILETEFHYFDVLNEMNIDQPVVFLCDRGTVDGIAYIGKASFENNILDKFSLTYSDLRDRYSGVIGLVSAADGAPEFYKMDDEREEDLEEAALLDKRTMGAWRLHQHFSVIDNSTDFPAKINRALAALNRIVGMPITTEIEKKYVVRNFSQTQLPLGTECFEIVQVYLNRQVIGPEWNVVYVSSGHMRIIHLPTITPKKLQLKSKV
jgi:predicted ATPase